MMREHSAIVEETRLGWELGRFVLETYEPGAGSKTWNEVWADYQDWCKASSLVALSRARFTSDFDALVIEADMDRRQVGGNVEYLGLLKRGG